MPELPVRGVPVIERLLACSLLVVGCSASTGVVVELTVTSPCVAVTQLETVRFHVDTVPLTRVAPGGTSFDESPPVLFAPPASGRVFLSFPSETRMVSVLVNAYDTTGRTAGQATQIFQFDGPGTQSATLNLSGDCAQDGGSLFDAGVGGTDAGPAASITYAGSSVFTNGTANSVILTPFVGAQPDDELVAVIRFSGAMGAISQPAGGGFNLLGAASTSSTVVLFTKDIGAAAEPSQYSFPLSGGPYQAQAVLIQFHHARVGSASQTTNIMNPPFVIGSIPVTPGDWLLGIFAACDTVSSWQPVSWPNPVTSPVSQFLIGYQMETVSGLAGGQMSTPTPTSSGLASGIVLTPF